MCIYYKSFRSLHSSFSLNINSSFPWWPESSPCVAVMVLCSLGYCLGRTGPFALIKLPQTSVFRVTASVSWGISPPALLSPCLFCCHRCILSPAIILSPVASLAASSLLTDENKVNTKWFQNQNHWHSNSVRRLLRIVCELWYLDLLDPSSCAVVFFGWAVPILG